MTASQKVAIVTGASQGLGAAIVQAYRQLGYRVVATSRNFQPSDDPNIVTVSGDIGDRATAQRSVAEAVSRFGRVDIFVGGNSQCLPLRSSTAWYLQWSTWLVQALRAGMQGEAAAASAYGPATV